MIRAGLKLDVYFGESLTSGRRMADDALMECFASHQMQVAALYRGIEGFGIGRRIHTERFPDISTDLPLVAEAIDTRERIEAVLPEVDSIIDKGLVTIEHSLLAVGDDVRAAEFPDGVGSAGRLTVYCGRGERAAGEPAYRAVVDLLRRQGASGATVLLGVDGIHNGQRRRAGLLSRNVDVPVATIAVGPRHVLRRVLQTLPDVLARPIANLERIAVVKHDGDLLEPLPLIHDTGIDEPPVWMALRVYTRQSARAEPGGALYTTLTRKLREAGAAGITTIRGEWGFSSDEPPSSDRLGTLTSHVPTYTVFVDRPSKIAEVWPTVDEITATHGVVTAAFVPAYRERARQVEHGRLTVRSAEDVAALYRKASTDIAQGPSIHPRIPAQALTAEDNWARSLVAEIREFAASHDRPQPLVRVTLADGEEFFLASLESRPGGGFVTLYPHPRQATDLVPGDGGSVIVPRSVVVPLSGLSKVEFLTHVPRGTRSNVGFLLP